jgi:hypothetical protein
MLSVFESVQEKWSMTSPAATAPVSDGINRPTLAEVDDDEARPSASLHEATEGTESLASALGVPCSTPTALTDIEWLTAALPFMSMYSASFVSVSI